MTHRTEGGEKPGVRLGMRQRQTSEGNENQKNETVPLTEKQRAFQRDKPCQQNNRGKKRKTLLRPGAENMQNWLQPGKNRFLGQKKPAREKTAKEGTAVTKRKRHCLGGGLGVQAKELTLASTVFAGDHKAREMRIGRKTADVKRSADQQPYGGEECSFPVRGIHSGKELVPAACNHQAGGKLYRVHHHNAIRRARRQRSFPYR